MAKETITSRQAACILIAFMIGSSVIFGIKTPAEQDTWISLLLATVEIIPLFLVYSRIMRLFPEKGIFDITDALFGKIFGKLLAALLCWYAVHLGALVIRNFSEFIDITTMPETPQLPIMIMITFAAVYIAKSGTETLGKWSVGVLFVILIVSFLIPLLSLNKMNLSNLLPAFDHSVGTIVSGSLSIAAFPFAETVLFLGVAAAVKRTDSPKKIYISAVLICCVIFLSAIVVQIAMLGTPL